MDLHQLRQAGGHNRTMERLSVLFFAIAAGLLIGSFLMGNASFAGFA